MLIAHCRTCGGRIAFLPEKREWLHHTSRRPDAYAKFNNVCANPEPEDAIKRKIKRASS